MIKSDYKKLVSYDVEYFAEDDYAYWSRFVLDYALATYVTDRGFGLDVQSWGEIDDIRIHFGGLVSQRVLENIFKRNYGT